MQIVADVKLDLVNLRTSKISRNEREGSINAKSVKTKMSFSNFITRIHNMQFTYFFFHVKKNLPFLSWERM